MKSCVITCDGCGATTSHAMRPFGWANLHVFIFDGEGNTKFDHETDRCARCMDQLAPAPREERITLTEEQIDEALGDRPTPAESPFASRKMTAPGGIRVPIFRCLTRHPMHSHSDHEGLQCGKARHHDGEHGDWRP